MKRKLPGYIMVNMVIYISLCIVLFAGGISAGYKFVENYRSDCLMRQCEAIDRSLLMYSKWHKAVLLDSVSMTEEENLRYSHTRIFPDSLNELGVIQDEQGYFSKEIDFSQFSYSVTKKNNGSMTYRLGVTLPNGKFYTSPQSDQEF